MRAVAHVTGFLRRHREGVWFVLLFSCYTVTVSLVLLTMSNQVVVPFTKGIAWVTHTLLRGLGVQAWVAGRTIGIPGFAVEIRNNCNAVFEIGLYAAAVFAYPAPIRQRVSGFVVGAIVLYLVNLLRVLSLLALGRYWPGGFQATHLYVWQALFLAVVTACWFGWTTRVRPVA